MGFDSDSIWLAILARYSSIGPRLVRERNIFLRFFNSDYFELFDLATPSSSETNFRESVSLGVYTAVDVRSLGTSRAGRRRRVLHATVNGIGAGECGLFAAR